MVTCHNAMSPETRFYLLAHFDTLQSGKHVLARGIRERPITPGAATVARTLRVFWFSILLAACGGGGHKQDTYARGTDVQQACCEHLQGDSRSSCLQQIVRVEDFAQKSAANQSTYGCVVDHFACDPATGHATKDSAQAQIDCIQDLQ
jgi:hypothetical protein